MRAYDLAWLIFKSAAEVVAYSLDLHFFLIATCHQKAGSLLKEHYWIKKGFFFCGFIDKVVVGFENIVVLNTIPQILEHRRLQFFIFDVDCKAKKEKFPSTVDIKIFCDAHPFFTKLVHQCKIGFSYLQNVA